MLRTLFLNKNLCLLSLFLLCSNTLTLDSKCVAPGTCNAPLDAKYAFILPTEPRHQWETDGGFCGALSIQTIALAHGVWISQDLIRKSASPGGGHGEKEVGYEILHTNIEEVLTNLGFSYDAFDHKNTPVPQAGPYLAWLKRQLALERGVVWFIMCKGDKHDCYGMKNCTYDHIEAVYGIWSNHPLSDHTVYSDDVLVHTSGYAPDGMANTGYYRRFDTLVDTIEMDKNCSDAQPEWRRNEAYPCVDHNFPFGYSITGLLRNGGQPVALKLDNYEEPNIRNGTQVVYFTGTVTCQRTTAGVKYGLYRFKQGNAGVPSHVKDYAKVAEKIYIFTAESDSHVIIDQHPILSSSAVAYRCLELSAQMK